MYDVVKEIEKEKGVNLPMLVAIAKAKNYEHRTVNIGNRGM